MAKKPKVADNTIVLNKKARHDYFIEDTFEAGLALQGWEVKALRLKKVQLIDSYVLIKDGEAWLLGCRITPLDTASTHTVCEPDRTRKLLLHSRVRSSRPQVPTQRASRVLASSLLPVVASPQSPQWCG